MKIVRLLVSDLQSHLEAAADSEEDTQSDSGEEAAGDSGRGLEAILHAVEEEQWEETEEDPDLQSDPLLQLDMQVLHVTLAPPPLVAAWSCDPGHTPLCRPIWCSTCRS